MERFANEAETLLAQENHCPTCRDLQPRLQRGLSQVAAPQRRQAEAESHPGFGPLLVAPIPGEPTEAGEHVRVPRNGRHEGGTWPLQVQPWGGERSFSIFIQKTWPKRDKDQSVPEETEQEEGLARGPAQTCLQFLSL